jgi:hypothetical protein
MSVGKRGGGVGLRMGRALIYIYHIDLVRVGSSVVWLQFGNIRKPTISLQHEICNLDYIPFIDHLECWLRFHIGLLASLCYTSIASNHPIEGLVNAQYLCSFTDRGVTSTDLSSENNANFSASQLNAVLECAFYVSKRLVNSGQAVSFTSKGIYNNIQMDTFHHILVQFEEV